jgi:hypothetical protein
VAGSLGQVTCPVGGLEVGRQDLDALAELRTKRLERLDIPPPFAVTSAPRSTSTRAMSRPRLPEARAGLVVVPN